MTYEYFTRTAAADKHKYWYRIRAQPRVIHIRIEYSTEKSVREGRDGRNGMGRRGGGGSAGGSHRWPERPTLHSTSLRPRARDAVLQCVNSSVPERVEVSTGGPAGERFRRAFQTAHSAWRFRAPSAADLFRAPLTAMRRLPFIQYSNIQYESFLVCALSYASNYTTISKVCLSLL